jgi:hypothetical protein
MQVENKTRNEPDWSNRLEIFPYVKSLPEASPFLRLDQTAHLLADLMYLTDLFSIW